jgi:hypothetical protein
MEETKCPKCGSNKIKTYEDENAYLHIKPEGEKTETYMPVGKRCFCRDCKNDWGYKGTFLP